MKLPQELGIPDLMGLITDIAPRVHIRLAVTPGVTPPPAESDGSGWVLRSLVVDVYPANWLDSWHKRKEGPLAECAPPVDNYDYEGQALFCLGYLPTDAIAKWLYYREGWVSGFDARDGHGGRSQAFRLPELQDIAFRNRVFSGQNDGFPRLPWPHFNYEYSLKGPNFSNNSDYQTLFSQKERFDDFREARGRLIHGLTDLRSYQDRDQIMIRVVDGDGWIRRAHLKGRNLKVTVAGRRLVGAQVILKGAGLGNGLDNKRDILGTGPVDFTLMSAPPSDVRVILANAESGDLDQAWLSPYSGPMDTSSPHFVVEEDDPDDEGAQQHASATPQPTAKREVKVIVVSPSDVMKERESVEDVLDDLNEGVARQLGLYLTSWRWETDSYPRFHAEGPQGEIDDQMRIDNADIVVGIFWRRIGSRTPDGKTGSEHELLKAIAAWEKTHERPHILVYFNQSKSRPKSEDESEQRRAVDAFKDQLKAKGLLGTYRSSRQFPDILRRALQRLLQDHYQADRELP